MKQQHSAVFLCSVLLVSLFASLPASAGGPPAQIVISTPSTVISSDGVLQMEATLYDSLNNVVEGEILWSASNGTIEQSGLFFPWSAGQVTIRADHGGFNDTVVVNVIAGFGQSIEINTSAQPRAKFPFVLQANLIDSHDNPRPGQDVVWTVDGLYIGQGEPSWTPPSLGLYEVVARYDQLEEQVTMEAIAGDPYEFVFPEDLIVRSGEGVQLYPDLLDSFGQKMNNTVAGNKAWTVENGTITPVGYYYASAPGIWNLSVRAGAIWGNSTIRVVPADASIVEIRLSPEEEVYVSGESYRLDAIRTDSQGYSSPVPIPIGNWSVANGILSQVGNEVHWTPGQAGEFSMHVVDSDVPASATVEVVHGSAATTRLIPSQPIASAGTQIALVHEAVDSFGNVWQTDANITQTDGVFASVDIFASYVSMMPKQVELLGFTANYFDASTGILHQSQWVDEVVPGRLAFIELPESGTEVAADSYLDFDPQFTDAYGNTIAFVAVNWTISGQDRTLEIRMADGKWYPTETGEHEIRANADGVFAAVRINVVPGTGTSLLTDGDTGLIIEAGVPSDLFVELVDVHGNTAPAESVVLLSGDYVLFDASSSGRGFWQLTGVTSGVYELNIAQDDAEHTLPLTIIPGQPVRVITGMANETRSQGEVTLITVWAEDSQGNRVEVNPDQTSLSCTSGKATHVKSDTWEVELEEAGSDRSCTVTWNGLISQQFYDVESVLLSGALGSTNTAVSIIIGLLLMIFIVLVVLIRRGNTKDEEWDDEEFYEVSEEEEEQLIENSEEIEDDVPTPTSPTPADQTHTEPELNSELRQELATKAGQVGVMQAAPGTNQGETGWYVDASTELQYWNVGADGSWTRVQ